MSTDIAIHQFPVLQDNYGFLVHDPASKETACIDTPDAAECLAQAEKRGWTITQIWNTHWHPDHAGGNEAVKAVTGCKIIAPEAESDKIKGIDREVSEGNLVKLGKHTAQVMDVGGHTSGHIAYNLIDQDIAFVGDALFALGCGRMFEGTPEQFWESLSKLKKLPEETLMFCAHEYTQANANFAVHADPDNLQLKNYAEWVDQKRKEGAPTVPFPLKRELDTNPFLRADDSAIQARWGGNVPHETFAALRAAKDAF
ncbi:hydroxyacylglutathione hydrolase [Aurantiacibacter atlanticus]|uniref:Hydroxyacylglutathione hydrolase n=1 Tax=Aurantiacibacter atlanticus TaxID=1648404 RepID=A0A0H4VK76_9SPHN|nr:hydroxyacylglutathione hydrolase [Aurantiacibacter atlanticus]AKQ43276.1 hydroxyacylglutathione hydrolase [Aurantiacibacter atlanticus]MDF1835166.1 hydroxyacylglutathione hydrolase [Alteraurantiacibacter sp. bin_em_oilr2.035]